MLLGTVVLVLVLLLTLRVRYRLTLVQGHSMLPALKTGDILLVDQQAYWHRSPARGDLVVVQQRRSLIVKRIVGLPGEEIEVRDGLVYINGVPESPSSTNPRGSLRIRPGRLAQGRYALLGDNRGWDGYTTVHAVVGSDELAGKVVKSWRW